MLAATTATALALALIVIVALIDAHRAHRADTHRSQVDAGLALVDLAATRARISQRLRANGLAR